MTDRKRFCLYLIKPSHYDDDGYVIQWYRSPIPSNSLASVYGLAEDCAQRHVLGDDWELDVHALDETNSAVDVEEVADEIDAADAGVVMLIGVQSNQFPRALDIARPLRARNIPVMIGGFHASGVLAMLNGEDAGLDEAKRLGVSIFAGEAEERLDGILKAARDGTLEPVYNYMSDLPGISQTPTPFIPAGHVARTAYNMTSFDAGRGCPYQCSFCTIINVQGRKSRYRSPDDIEKIVRNNLAQGVYRFFITDDNFARNKDWEAIMDRLIGMREVEKLHFNFIIQVDTLCHRIPNFIEKCARGGVKRVFIGLENINPANLIEAKKRQNKITEYREMLLAWKGQKVITYAGYIAGFGADTYDSLMHDIDVIKHELPIDILEFFYLTPLPGSEDHQKLFRAGTPMDADLNRYDLNHVTTAHGKMSRAEWERAYRDAWERYYTPEHIETIMRRGAKFGIATSNLLLLAVWFLGALRIEGVHPLECGALRLKRRKDRRAGMPIEPAILFYPKYWAETAYKWTRWLSLYFRFRGIMNRIEREGNFEAYSDLAITPETDHAGELYQSDAAKAWLDNQERLERIKRGAIAAE
ncbi:MAG: radical SAM protein [Hyphomicrobiaceae bacterium]|nr:radical SAM protein [Hyphomicrobiaceae bacterium]